jgi:hypothetical protein
LLLELLICDEIWPLVGIVSIGAFALAMEEVSFRRLNLEIWTSTGQSYYSAGPWRSASSGKLILRLKVLSTAQKTCNILVTGL